MSWTATAWPPMPAALCLFGGVPMSEYLNFIKYGVLVLLSLMGVGALFLMLFSGGGFGAGIGLGILILGGVYFAPVYFLANYLLKKDNPNTILVLILSIIAFAPILIIFNFDSFLNAIVPPVDWK